MMIKSRSRFAFGKSTAFNNILNVSKGFRVELDGVSAVIEVCFLLPEGNESKDFDLAES